MSECIFIYLFFLQQIDEMLAGSLSQEDEEAVLTELAAITQVHASPSDQVSAYFKLIIFPLTG